MLEQTSTQLAMLYYVDSKKHLPGRIVPLRVPLPGLACAFFGACQSRDAKNHSTCYILGAYIATGAVHLISTDQSFP